MTQQHPSDAGTRSSGSRVTGVSSSRQVGRSSWYYAFMGCAMAIVFLLLLVFDAVLIGLGLTVPALHADFGVGGIATAAAVAVAIAFIGVLWPIGILSQVFLDFALASRSRRASDNVPLARVTRFAGLGPTVDVLVQTPFTRRWNMVGNLGWLPNVWLILGAYGVGLAISILGSTWWWVSTGASAAGIVVAVIIAAVLGIVLFVTGVRVRLAKAASAANVKSLAADRESQAEHRDELRRAKLTPAERAAEDAKIADLLGKVRGDDHAAD